MNTLFDSSPSLPRHRTSPRTNSFGEVIELIDAQIAEMEKRQAGEQGDFSTTFTVLRTLREQVEAKIGTQSPKTVPTRQHFVGEMGDGTMAYVKGSEDESVVHLWGPFHTRGGAQYAIDHSTYTNHPKVR